MDAGSHPALLLVDGVSSIGALNFQFDKWKVDVAVTGSQKALSLPTGLAVLAISEKVKRQERAGSTGSTILSWLSASLVPKALRVSLYKALQECTGTILLLLYKIMLFVVMMDTEIDCYPAKYWAKP